MFLSDAFVAGSWAEHLASYWRVRSRPNVLVLTYEQLSADLPGAVRRVAAFMGVTLSETELEAVVRQSNLAPYQSSARTPT